MPHLDTLKKILPGWANQMYARFGHPVYLVGSCLRSEAKPRDIDVSIIIPDDEFRGRYGDPEQWEFDTWEPEWREARQRWALDMGKLASYVSRHYHVNIDLKVIPQSYADKFFSGKERFRIDTIKD